MKTTCLINNFNYERFVFDAIESALNQSISFDEIIIVDDCSTDNSLQMLKDKFLNHPQIKIIAKEINEGQLSSFNSGFLASSGDLIFFLDSDDVYHAQYLKTAISIYREKKECDFLFFQCYEFNDEASRYFEATQDMTISDVVKHTQDLGYSLASALCCREYVGGPTSGLSMRRSIVEKIFPIPYLEDWRTRADDCLVFGASIVKAKKFQANLPLIGYRIHGNNSHYGNKSKLNSSVYYQRQISLKRLFLFLCQRMNYPDNLFDLAPFEFKTIDKPTWRILWVYIRIYLHDKGLLNGRIYGILVMLKHMLRSTP